MKTVKTTNFALITVIGFGLASFPAAAQINLSSVSGVPNFHQVNQQVYRGAQPNAQGFQGLAKLGVKTVIDLREGGSRSVEEQKEVEAAGMRYISIPFNGMSAPSPANVAKVLALFEDVSSGPVFVHCRRGADRTGTVVACYRIAHDGWDNHKALQEAKSNGMSWTEIAMQHYVLGFHPVASATTGTATTAVANN